MSRFGELAKPFVSLVIPDSVEPNPNNLRNSASQIELNNLEENYEWEKASFDRADGGGICTGVSIAR